MNTPKEVEECAHSMAGQTTILDGKVKYLRELLSELISKIKELPRYDIVGYDGDEREAFVNGEHIAAANLHELLHEYENKINKTL